MFGFFKKKKVVISKDLIWKNELVKYNALLQQLQQPQKFILLYYFEDTKQIIETLLTNASVNYTESASFAAKVWLMKANSLLQKSTVDNREIIFAEHHPSHAAEQAVKNHLAETLFVQSATFYTSFEDPLMQLFGAERILSMMEKMGYKEDECIEHTMISNSIERAQQKIDEKTPMPTETRLRKDWFIMNALTL